MNFVSESSFKIVEIASGLLVGVVAFICFIGVIILVVYIRRKNRSKLKFPSFLVKRHTCKLSFNNNYACK